MVRNTRSNSRLRRYTIGVKDVENRCYYGWIPRLFNDTLSSRNWSHETEILHYALSERSMVYLTSLYYTLSLLTSVGFGNVAAHTEWEKVVCIVYMLFGGKIVGGKNASFSCGFHSQWSTLTKTMGVTIAWLEHSPGANWGTPIKFTTFNSLCVLLQPVHQHTIFNGSVSSLGNTQYSVRKNATSWTP